MLRRLSARLLVASLALLPATGWALQPGDQAPDFALQDVHGTEHRLSDYRGQVVLVALAGHN